VYHQWIVSDNCPKSTFYDFISAVRTGALDRDMLRNLDNISQVPGTIQDLVHECFPLGVNGSQPVIDPVSVFMGGGYE
jgi:hypothetical protein